MIEKQKTKRNPALAHTKCLNAQKAGEKNKEFVQNTENAKDI